METEKNMTKAFLYRRVQKNSIRSGIAIVSLLQGMILLWSCTGEKVPDCFQSTGKISRETVEAGPFNRITVYENVSLVLKQGAVQKVEVATGANLRPEVHVEVRDGTLLLSDTNDCNLFRDYGTTTVYVTSPEIAEIRSSSGFPIRSDGVLNYEDLTLYAESFLNPGTETTDGSFILELASGKVTVTVNGIAYFKLKGTVENLNIVIAAGDSRVEAADLLAGNVSVNHRGSNDILLNPRMSLTGVIRGTGDVICYNRPPEVAVQELYRGRLIFRN